MRTVGVARIGGARISGPLVGCFFGATLMASVAHPQTTHEAPPLVGAWGGDGIRVDSAAAGVRIQVACFTARLDQPIRPTAAGAFTIAVTFVPIRGVANADEDDRPASWVSGTVDRDAMTLTIEPRDQEPGGAFTLRRNAKATLPNCRMRG